MQVSASDWQKYAKNQEAITETAGKKMSDFLAKQENNIERNFEEVANEKQWVAYRLGERNGKVTKIPVNPATGGNAMTNNPATWGTLEQAQGAISKFGADGVGFVFGNDYFGIDLDNVIDPISGTVLEYAQEIVDSVASYAEVSPSGRGIHIIAKGNPSFPTNKNGAIEMYFPTTLEDGTISRGRYFTVTGQSFGKAIPIAERTEEAQGVWAKFVDGKPKLPTTVLHISADQTVDYAYALATKYGEARAALACEMYDALAAAQGANVPPAVPAKTATYQETGKAVRGTFKNGNSTLSATVGRLAKQAGADTMLHNAARDGAEFAWIPLGDSCPFCIMLASRGWQKQRKKDHAEHIHANCNCNYVVRFDGKTNVKGYDPDKYKAMYDNAEGDNWREKLKSMRNEFDI